MKKIHASHDRNLLFGVLAFQLDFVTQAQLIETMQAWMMRKEKSLGEVLVEKGFLTTQRRELLDTLVAEHVRQHGDDPERSLAAINYEQSLRQELQRLGDPEVSRAAGLLHTSRRQNLPEDGIGMATMPHMAHVEDGVPQRFSVIRPLAEGGLGIVSVAHDAELTREVALKEIKPAFADHNDSRARFLKEAEITGRLEHPGIVPVYGLGTYPDGRPYYAMRMIKGSSLKEAIDEFHLKDSAKRDPTSRTLELRELLQRFIDVCNAMEYAHSRGILHRDLKPANIMLGKYRETLVVDWGLAKSIGETEQQTLAEETVIVPELGGESVPTRMGEVVGTIAFMSPEQAAGKQELLGTASDVYSLGATLYALLTGKVSQSGADAGTLLRNILAGKFTKPREIKRNLAPQLEAICLKAMALKPLDRYLSAKAMADDLEHFLADEPIAAIVEPFSIRVRRWVRKHPRTVSTMVVGVLSMLLLSAVWAMYSRKIADERTRSSQQLEVKNKALQKATTLAEEKQREAEERRKQAEQVKEFMVNAFRSPDPGRDGKTVRVFEVLPGALAEIDKEFPQATLVKGELFEAIGRTYLGLGLPNDALPLLRQGGEIFAATLGANDPRTRAVWDRLATALADSDQFDASIELFTSNLRKLQEAAEPNLMDIVNATNNLAGALISAGRTKDAIQLYEETRTRLEEGEASDPEAMLSVTQGLAECLRKADQADKALPLFQESLDQARGALGEENPTTLTLMSNVAACQLDLGALDLALPLLEQTLEKRSRILGPDHPDTILSIRQLADGRRAQGDLAGARALYEQALKLFPANQGRGAYVASTRNGLAECLLGMNRVTEGIQLLEGAESKLAASHPETLRSRHDLARGYFLLDQLTLAKPLAAANLEARRAQFGATHRTVRTSMELWQKILTRDGDFAAAEGISRAWLAALQEVAPQASMEAVRARLSLAVACARQGKWKEARELLELARKDLVATGAEVHEQLRADALEAYLLVGEQSWEEAEKLLLRTFKEQRKHLADASPEQRGYVLETCEYFRELYKDSQQTNKVPMAERQLELRRAEILKYQDSGSGTESPTSRDDSSVWRGGTIVS